MIELKKQIAANVARVQAQIRRAAEQSCRDPKEVTIVAVTKTFRPEYLLTAYELGLRHFGENRVEEAADKRPVVQKQLSSREKPTWHMIGHLQHRKARTALQLFDLIHSVDSLRLAERMDRMCQDEGRDSVSILLEVNTSGEEQKYGFPMHQWPPQEAQWADLEWAVGRILKLPRVRIRGLMTMAPLITAENTRPYFRRLRLMRGALMERFPHADWSELSMGMTHDFEVAVQEGATLVRIGRGIFSSPKEN